MRCPCGHEFKWFDARPMVPCRRCHIDPEEGWMGRYKTCRHCSKAAKAQAAVAKAGVATAIAPVAAVGATVAVAGVATAVAVAATVAAVPAVAVGPFALAYEPVRRLRKKKSNPLAKAAASGAFVAGAGLAIGVMLLSGYESD